MQGLSGEGERRKAGSVVGGIGAIDAAATSVAAGERAEVEPRLGTWMTDRLEAAAALGTRDRPKTTIANGEDRASLRVGGVNHLGSRLSGNVRWVRGRAGEEILAPVVTRL